MPHQDRGGAINLLQQHDAHELMRPGERAEGQPQRRLIRQSRCETVRAADHEDGVARGIVPDAQPIGECI